MKWVGLDLVDKQGQANTLNRERGMDGALLFFGGRGKGE